MLNNLASAFIKAQADMEPLHKDASNPHLKSKYATLASVQDVCLPAFRKHGIAVFQSVATDWSESGVLVRVICTLYHAETGENLVTDIGLIPTKADPQGIGSAITYGRRYTLLTAAGIAPEDDDGNEASGTQTKKPQPTQQQTQRQPASAPTPVHRQPNTTATPADDVSAKWKEEADALRWGFSSDVFAAKPHCVNAYNKVKAENPNASTQDIYKLWIADVERRVNEKQAARVAA